MTNAVVFLFTDIEGSSARWERAPRAMESALARHDALLRSIISDFGGSVFKTIGDAFCATFGLVEEAIHCAREIHRKLDDSDWGEIGSIRVRIAIGLGEVQQRDGDYFGPVLNRIARILAVGHGGQTLLDTAVARIASVQAIETVDLGLHRLPGLQRPEQLHQLAGKEFPSLRSQQLHPNNISSTLPDLIGRDEEIDTLVQLVREHPQGLVTLVGPGGVGKTSLALEVASRLIERRDGVFVVPLASLMDANQIITAISEVLGLRDVTGELPITTLVSYLGEMSMLLLLDNLEHLPGAGLVISNLLAQSPTLLVVATSRAPLKIRGERLVTIEPLSTESPAGERSPAVRLFEARTGVRGGDSSGTPVQTAIAAICARLDGLPLAIELAAARTRVLSPSQILDRLDKRLPLLTGGAVDSPARQQTLRDTIGWSFDLLSESDRELFLALSICNGGCGLDDAVSFSSGQIDEFELLDGLGRLVDNHLITVRDLHDRPRFDMLQTIREFGVERAELSSRSESWRRRHAEIYRDLLDAAQGHLAGRDQEQWLIRLQDDLQNIRQALDYWIKSTDITSACAMVLASVRFWRIRGLLSEGRAWLEQAVSANPQPPDRTKARLLDELGIFLQDLGMLDEASGRHHEALRHYVQMNETRGIAEVTSNLATIALFRGDYGDAKHLYRESETAFRTIGDLRGATAGLNGLGMVAFSTGDLDSAIALYEQTIVEWRAMGDIHSLAVALGNTGHALIAAGNHSRAQVLSEEALDLFIRIGDPIGEATARLNLAFIALQFKELSRAAVLFEESGSLAFEHDDPQTATESVLGMALVALGRGFVEQSVSSFAFAARQRDEIGHHFSELLQRQFDDGVSHAHQLLDRAEFERNWERGRAQSLPEVLGRSLG